MAAHMVDKSQSTAGSQLLYRCSEKARRSVSLIDGALKEVLKHKYSSIVGVCLVTQSDPGTENYGIANCHTTLRHQLDNSLAGTLQHRFMRDKSNIKPEIMWSILRRTWSTKFENIIQDGVNRGFYNPINTMEKCVKHCILLI